MKEILREAIESLIEKCEAMGLDTTQAKEILAQRCGGTNDTGN